MTFILYPPLLTLLQGLALSFPYPRVEMYDIAMIVGFLMGVPLMGLERFFSLSVSSITGLWFYFGLDAVLTIIDSFYRYFFACLIDFSYTKIKKK